MNALDIADLALEQYIKQIDSGLDTHQARAVALDEVRAMAVHVAIIEEPECCDALPRVEWLHHSTCPEVQAHHSCHETAHQGCPVCAAQKRLPVEPIAG